MTKTVTTCDRCRYERYSHPLRSEVLPPMDVMNLDRFEVRYGMDLCGTCCRELTAAIQAAIQAFKDAPVAISRIAALKAAPPGMTRMESTNYYRGQLGYPPLEEASKVHADTP